MALDQLEATLKKQWRLGQSSVLCWAFDPNGLLTIVVPHYFSVTSRHPIILLVRDRKMKILSVS